MKQTLTVSIITAFILSVTIQISIAQEATSRQTITRGGYTLLVINNDPSFSEGTRQRMIEAFFTVYPREARRFNKHTLKKVTFLIDPTYKGVAETDNGQCRYNPQWLKNHPEDIDVVTHEVMHIVQDYRHDNPGWLTEGIADYARYVYGVNNVKSTWTLPEYNPHQNYENAYRVTARFLLWVEKNKDRKIVDQMDAALRDGKYKPGLWAKLTGKNIDELSSQYGNNPAGALMYR